MTDRHGTPEGEASHLRLESRDGAGFLVFDRTESKVNLLTETVMMRLNELLGRVEEMAARGELAALTIRSAKPHNFIAGADIDELARLDDAESATELAHRGQGIFRRLAGLDVPTLAAIRGSCMGGGLEMALACDYRVCADDPATRLGLPETRLGILPGLGGTVRLPRLIGLRRALDMILSGRSANPERARSIGLVDRTIDADGFDAVIDRLAAALARGETPLDRQRRSLRTRLEDSPPGRWLIRRMARKGVMKRTKGHYPAPLKALEVTVDGLGRSVSSAHDEEARAFGTLAVTPECKNLIAVFRLTEGARKRAPAGHVREVSRGAVVGAGVMGAGIAELFAYEGIPVQVVDLDRERVDAGLEHAQRLLEKAAQRKNWSPEVTEEKANCLVGTTDYDGFGDVDLVVEAVVERMDVKRDVFQQLETALPASAVIATNTSALSISELQAGLEHPGRACGLHFFNPPHRMPLVEIVRGRQTSDDALATAFELATRLGKTPVVVEDRPGFVVNRILAPYLNEAGHLLMDGLSIEAVDEVMSDFGMPMGPFRLLDEIGLDVVAEVSETLQEKLGPRFAPADIMTRVIETGRTGKKGGAGFYRYRDGDPAGVDPEIVALVGAQQDGPEPRVAEERMVYAMVNEAARALDEGIVDQPHEIDVAMIMGAGFPPFRGGLLRYADSVGLDRIADRLRSFAGDLGSRFEPADGLIARRAFFPR